MNMLLVIPNYCAPRDVIVLELVVAEISGFKQAPQLYIITYRRANCCLNFT